jgi:excisionase family DNA binding protein
MIPLYTVREIAVMLNVGHQTIYNCINNNSIKHVRFKNNARLFDEESVNKIVQSVQKTDTIKYYPLKTTETFYIYESKINK